MSVFDMPNRGGMLRFCTTGTTRFVIATSRWAFKLARGPLGARCNLEEAKLYRAVSDWRRQMLCPVLWCMGSGRVLIARAAEPISGREAAALRNGRGFPDWDYRGPGDLPCPFEPKASDWGRVEGRLVAVDYAGLVDER